MDEGLFRKPRKEVPAPSKGGPETQTPPQDAEVSREQVLPAPDRPRGDRPLPEGQDPQGGGRLVLVVRGRKATGPLPPLY